MAAMSDLWILVVLVVIVVSLAVVVDVHFLKSWKEHDTLDLNMKSAAFPRLKINL